MSLRSRRIGKMSVWSRLLGNLATALFATFVLAVSAHAQIAYRAAANASSANTAVLYRGTGTVSVGDGSATPGLPSSWQAGDLHLCIVAGGNNKSLSISGWTQLHGQSGNDSGTKYSFAIFYRLAQSGDSTPTVTMSGSGTVQARIVGFYNVDPTTPIESGSAFTNSGLDQSTEASSILTSADGSMLVFTTHTVDNYTSVGLPSGGGTWTQAFFNANITNEDTSIAAHYRLMTTAGTAPAQASTRSGGINARAYGGQLAIRPNTNALAIAKPSGTVDGDVMVATVAARPRDITITAPSGWTQLQTHQSTNTDAASVGMTTWYKVASGEGSEYSWSFGGGTHAGTVGGIVAVSGADTSTPVDASGGNTTVSGFTHQADSITTTIDETVLVGAFAFPSATSDWTAPTGMSEAVDAASLTRPNTAGISMEMAYQSLSSAGATGVRIASAASSGTDAGYGVAHLAALRRSAAAPTVTTNAASGIGTNGATLNGTVSSNRAATTVSFEYGLTTSYGSSVTATQSPLAANASNSAVSAALTGLTCGTTYHFRVVGSNSAGTTNGGDLSFTTSACAPASCNSGAIASGVLNTYYPGTASAATGATSISVGSSSGAATTIAANDMLLVVQMQDENISTANSSSYGTVSGTPTAGQYEYVLAAGPVSGGSLPLAAALTNSYTASAYDGTNGQKTFQVIRVPAYSTATLPASGLAAQAWNGSTGGVLALDVAGTLTLNGATVDLSGKGFRGGGGCRWIGDNVTSGISSSDYRRNASTTCPSGSRAAGRANGSKAEGIAGTPRYVYDGSARVDTAAEGYANGSTGRGAPGNAGGGGTDDDPANNDENTGGGGGGGYGSGGTGGYAWSNASSPGRGLGGSGITQAAAKLTLGGGGGAGTSNNGTADGNGLNSSGVAGGGIIMMRAGSLSGTATFTAKGNDNNLSINHDGSGGGGGGGAVLVSAGSGLSGVTINVAGGAGGTNDTNSNGAHGPGGGGGGGYAITTSAVAACTVSGGSAGLTTDTGDGYANSSYGASAGSVGSCATSGSLAGSIPGSALGTGACAPSVNHYAIGHSGAGITCEAEPVTFTAHDASHSRVDAGGRTLSITATNATGGAATGTWVASDGSVCSTTCYDTSGTAVSCANTPTYTPSGTSTGTASYLFATGESGIRLCLKQSSAITQNINVTDGSVTEGSSEDTALAFANTGFRFYADGSVDTLGNLVAGLGSDVTDATYQSAPQVLTVRAVKSSETTSARCIPLIGSATKTVKFAYQCIDPTSCHASSRLEVNGTTVAGSGGVPTPSSDVSVAFNASGYGSINLKYWDVGQIKLYAQAAIADAATGGTATIATGSSNTFLVRPFGFKVIPCVTLSGGVCTSAPDDPGTSGGGDPLIKAGSTFNATINAVAYDGTTVTRSFGLGTGNGTESAALSYTLVAPTGVCSGPTNCPATLGGTTSLLRSTFSDGNATVTDLTWGEVGVIALTATNATFQGTTLSPAASGTSANLGRFYPHHFGLTGAVQTRSDRLPSTGSVFTYMDEPMRMTFTVTAYNAGETATQNYAGSFAKLNATGTGSLGSTTANWTCTSGSQCMGLGAVNGATNLSGRLAIDTTAGFGSSAPSNSSWSGGGSSFTAFVVFGRPSGGAVDGPYQALKVGAKPLDSDGVTLPPRGSTDTTHCVNLDVTTGTENASCDPGTTEANLRRKLYETDVRFGKLTVANASGSERQSLPVGVTAWYYNGSPTGWVVNTNDALTALPTSFTGHADNTTTDACFGAACTGNTGGGTNSIWLHDVGGTSIAQAAAPNASSALSSGRGSVTLSAPSISGTPTPGTLEFTLVTPAWLKTNSGKNGTAGNYDWNPMGRVTFGVYNRGGSTAGTKFIYIRENY